MKLCLRCQRAYPETTVVCETDGDVLADELNEYSAEPSRLVGRVIGGRYIIVRLLGSGGMGLVVEVRHAVLGTAAAVKLLHPGLTTLEDVRSRFLREARAAASVADPCVVRVIDFGVTTAGILYLVMERLDGLDLFGWLSDRGTLDVETAAYVGLRAAEALVVLHSRGFVHRDLKPENIWIVNPSAPASELLIKLLDFGVVGLLEPTTEVSKGALTPASERRLTRTGMAVGTPTYMSPEQVRGETEDGRADIYSLGCVLWELIVGRPAFPGSSPVEVMAAHLSGPLPSLRATSPAVPPWLDAVVGKATRKDPNDRFSTAAHLADALRAGLSGKVDGLATLPAVPDLSRAPEGEDSSPVRRRSGMVIAGWAISAVAVAAFAGAAVMLHEGDLAKTGLEPESPPVSAPASGPEPEAVVAAQPTAVVDVESQPPREVVADHRAERRPPEVIAAPALAGAPETVSPAPEGTLGAEAAIPPPKKDPRWRQKQPPVRDDGLMEPR